jgi:hypothetical protein
MRSKVINGLQSPNIKKYFFIFIFSLVIFFPLSSYSIQFSIFGDYNVRLIDIKNLNVLNPDTDEDLIYLDLRLRLMSILEINENTKGIVAFESGHTVFGIDDDISSEENVPGTDSINLKFKNAYLDVILPNGVSNFKAGLQPFNLFDGLLANEDAFGITYLVDADRKIQVNYVKIYDNGIDEEYLNETNPERSASFMSASYENDIFKDDTYNLLIGYYLDKNAIISDITYTKRKALYMCFGYYWDFHGVDLSLNAIYEKGRKNYIDEITALGVSMKSVGYLIDFIAEKNFESLDLNFEFLFASGDKSPDDERDDEFMPVDGLANFYDRAYILTGYITKDDADEKEGIFDSEVYNLANVAFFKLGADFKLSSNKRLDLSIIYALNDEKIATLSSDYERDIGTEVDATFSIDLTNTYYQTQNGLLFNIFGAYFSPGKNYQSSDGTDAKDIFLAGAGLEYIF